MNAKKAAAMIAIKASSADMDKGLADARKKLRAFGNDAKKIGGKVWGAGKGALSKIGSGLGIQAAAGITETVSGIRDFERNLVRLQIAAGKSDVQIHAMRDAIAEVSRATGVSREDILAGTQAYVDLTGDVAGAEAAMSSFARIAQASGAEVSDVATATAALKESMHLDPRDIEAAFSGMIQQGKAGAVSLKDLAGQLSRVAPQFAKFGGSGVKGIADLGAALQIVRKGFGSSEQGAVGLQNLMTALSMNAGKFEKAGVKIFDKDPKTGVKRFRSFVDIVDQIGASKLAKDPALLTKAFGSSEASRAFDMLSKNRAELEAIYEAGLDAGAVQRDLSTFMESSAGKLDVAMNNLKMAVVEAFTPERIAAFASAVESLASGLSTLIEKLGAAKDYLGGDQEYEAMRNPYAVNPEDVGSSAWRVAAGMDSQGGVEERMKGIEDQRKYLATLPGAPGDAARRQIENSRAFADTSSSISGAGSREAMIKQAVRASYGGGTEGERKAGDQYLAGTKVSPEKIAGVRAQTVADDEQRGRATLNALLPQLTKFLGQLASGGVTVKMDSSTVSKTVSNSPAQRAPRSR